MVSPGWAVRRSYMLLWDGDVEAEAVDGDVGDRSVACFSGLRRDGRKVVTADVSCITSNILEESKFRQM